MCEGPNVEKAAGVLGVPSSRRTWRYQTNNSGQVWARDDTDEEEVESVACRSAAPGTPDELRERAGVRGRGTRDGGREGRREEREKRRR